MVGITRDFFISPAVWQNEFVLKEKMISIFEVEEGALSHLEIEDAAAIGIPSEMGEEDIRLFVILKPSSSLTKDMIRTHCPNGDGTVHGAENNHHS